MTDIQTARPRELAARRPAEVVVTERRTDPDFDQPFPVFVQVSALIALEQERARRLLTEVPHQPLTTGQLWFLRAGGTLLLLFGMVGFVIASMRTY